MAETEAHSPFFRGNGPECTWMLLNPGPHFSPVFLHPRVGVGFMTKSEPVITREVIHPQAVF